MTSSRIIIGLPSGSTRPKEFENWFCKTILGSIQVTGTDSINGYDCYSSCSTVENRKIAMTVLLKNKEAKHLSNSYRHTIWFTHDF